MNILIVDSYSFCFPSFPQNMLCPPLLRHSIRFMSAFPHQPAMHSGRASHGGSGELCATQWKPTKHTDGATNCFLTGRREKVVYYGHMDRII